MARQKKDQMEGQQNVVEEQTTTTIESTGKPKQKRRSSSIISAASAILAQMDVSASSEKARLEAELAKIKETEKEENERLQSALSTVAYIPKRALIRALVGGVYGSKENDLTPEQDEAVRILRNISLSIPEVTDPDLVNSGTPDDDPIA